MFTFISILIIIAAILMVLIVLVQNSKGGGLSAGFQSSNQIMGVRRTTDFLEKATWTLAGALVVLSILASMTIPRHNQEGGKSLIQEKVEGEVNPDAVPNFPTAPANNQPAQPQESQPDQTAE